VGHQGAVVWHGAHGVADVDKGTPISETTVFDVGSVTKQFTASTILLLAADGKLALDDAVSDHVDGLPAWGDDVTIEHLMHHASGIPDYFSPMLDDKGYTPEDQVERKAIFKTIAGMKKLDFKPGTNWSYSNSNYVLLGYAIEEVSGAPLSKVLADRIFDPLRLGLVMEPVDPVSGQARSYAPNATEYDLIDWPWDNAGAGGIQSRLTDLIRWADNYRTGKVGGQALLDAQVAHAVESDDDEMYGAGILIRPDGSTYHQGEWEGFHTLLDISADRTQVLVVACNLSSIEVSLIGYELNQIWQI
jgi:CubicO group peptidase (beta-lactamase class C family)